MVLSRSLIAQQHTRFISERSPSSVFFSSAYNNPATKQYFLDASYWKISSGVANNALKSKVQNGDEISKFIFNTESFLLKEKTLFYGNILYENGKKRNVKWSESSDYELLYPCVMADSLGGDFAFEEYYFKGGFSKQMNKLSLGIEAYYRANYQFRDVDPRPRNIVSDYEIKLGASSFIGDKYILGFDLKLGSYTQNNSINMFRQDAKEKFYMMSGFGLYDKMFSKTYGNIQSYYDIKKTGLSFQFLPKDKYGFYAQASYCIANMKQDISGFNDVNIAGSKTNFLYTEIGYKTDSDYQFLFFYKRKDKLASQNIYSEMNFNSFKLITKYKKFSSDNISLGTSHLLDFKDGKSLALDVLYNRDVMKFASYNSLQDISKLESLVKVYIFNAAFNLELNVGYSKNLSSELKVNTEMMAENAYEEMLKPNFYYLSDDKFMTGFVAEYFYKIKDKTSLFTRLNCKVEKYKRYSWESSVRILLGVKF